MTSPPDPGNLERDGFCLFTDVLSGPAIERLTRIFLEAEAPALLRRAEAAFGGRNLLNLPAIVEIAGSAELARLVQPVVGPHARAVRGLFFDKTPEANWPVL